MRKPKDANTKMKEIDRQRKGETFTNNTEGGLPARAGARVAA